MYSEMSLKLEGVRAGVGAVGALVRNQSHIAELFFFILCVKNCPLKKFINPGQFSTHHGTQ